MSCKISVVACVFGWEMLVLADLKISRVIEYRQKVYNEIPKSVIFVKKPFPTPNILSITLLGGLH